MAPNGNRIVVYKGPGQVAVETVDYPKLEVPQDVASSKGMTRTSWIISMRITTWPGVWNICMPLL